MMKYENWRELSKSCQESEMSVHGWCKANKIPFTTCRQWLARLKKENQDSQAAEQDADLSIWGKVDLEKSNLDCHQFFPSAIKLSYRGWNIEINESFDPMLLSRIMKVVETVC